MRKRNFILIELLVVIAIIAFAQEICGSPLKVAQNFANENSEEKPAVVASPLIKDGVIGKVPGCNVLVNTTQPTVDNPLKFAGDASTKLQIKVPQKASMSFVADVIVDELPKTGISEIVTRRGCHSVLGIDPRGRVIFTMWYADKSTVNQVLAKRLLQVGETTRIAATVDVQDGQTTISLYLDGQLQNTRTTAQMPYPYGPVLNIGNKLKGGILNLFWAGACLSQEELQNL
ncbi:MAG: hypothetical protein LBM70_05965 [Victivallales bacterium]|jgi:hypothetical protein|nr:hypothetical protein [Victivallales bacterium]